MAKKNDTSSRECLLWRRETDYANLAPGAGYGDGNKAGEAAAWSFIKEAATKSPKQWQNHGGTLQHLAFRYLDAAAKFQDEPQRTFIRGEVVGAFSLLDWFVHESAKFANHQDKTEESLTALAEQARAGYFDAQWLARVKAEESQRARDAANVRWAKHRAAKALAAANMLSEA